MTQGMTPLLAQLRFRNSDTDPARRAAVTGAVMAELQRLPQAGHIDQEVMRRWTAQAVESTMVAVAGAWRLPRRAGGEDREDASAWDGAGEPQFNEAVQILQSEIAALGRITPREVAEISAGENIDRQWATIARQKLLQAPASGAQRWVRQRQRRFMQGAWRGGVGPEAEAGWVWDRDSRQRLALRMQAPPGAIWLPGILREGSPGATPAPVGRAVLVDYLWTNKTTAYRLAKGEMDELERMTLACQWRLCQHHQITPWAVGYCIYDPEGMCWHWCRQKIETGYADAAHATARKFWSAQVMQGKVPEWETRTAPPAPGAAETILRGWLTRRAARHLATARAERNVDVRTVLEAALPGNATEHSQELPGLCTAKVRRVCGEEDLQVLGEDISGLRLAADKTIPDWPAVLARLLNLRRDVVDMTAAEVEAAIASIARNPPIQPGSIDQKKALDLARQKGALAMIEETTLSFGKDDQKAGEVIRKLGLAIDKVIEATALELLPPVTPDS